MDDNITRFEKFIIKKLVDAVSYDPKTEEYHFNRIQISNDTLKSIDSEGVRYGLKKDVIRTMVSNLASNIKTNPSIDEIHGSIEVGAINPASHLEIVVRNEEKGRRSVELLSLGDNAFYVLSSNIAGIDYGMNLLALDRVWVNDYMIDFKVIKEGRLFPSKNHILRLGKLESVDFFIPSVIHEILDADTDYSVPHNKTEQTFSNNI